MRVGIDATSWTNWRGFGRFTRSIIQTLLTTDSENEYLLFFDSTYHAAEGVPGGARVVVVETTDAQTEAISVHGRRSALDLARMARAARKEPVDVFFFPSIDSYFPVFGPAARIVMIHDVIPEDFPRVMLPNRASRVRRRVKVRAAIAQAHLIATGSRLIGERVARTFGVPEERLCVIPYGVAGEFRPMSSRDDVVSHVVARYGIRPPYFLHVGGFGPNKNICGLLDAFAALASRRPTSAESLVFVGKRDGDAVYAEAAEIDRRLNREEIRNRVLCLGFQPDIELVALYQAASALVLPSLAEGFGLPAIEAVSCGTPAIVTTASPLPEILGDAAIAVDPSDVNALVTAMETMLTDKTFANRAALRAGTFGWDKSAGAAIAAFERAQRLRVVRRPGL